MINSLNPNTWSVPHWMYVAWGAEYYTLTFGKKYSIFKDDICAEKYLIVLPRTIYLPLCKFRTSNHKLPIEIGRWENIPLNERQCTLCNSDIGDEFHYLFKCNHFAAERNTYIKQYFYKRPNIIKFNELMSTSNKVTLTKLSKFVNIIMKTFVWDDSKGNVIN